MSPRPSSPRAPRAHRAARTAPARRTRSTTRSATCSPARSTTRSPIPSSAEPPAGPPAAPVQPEASARAAADAASVAASHARPAAAKEPRGSRRPCGRAATPGAAAQHDRLEELKSNVHVELLKELGPHLYDANMDQHELDRRVRAVLADVLAAQDRPLSTSDRARVTQEISDDILGYGPIEPFLRDPDVSEVMVNGPDSIWLEKNGRLTPRPPSSRTRRHLRRTIDKIVSRIGRRVDESSPMVDARLPDGSRVNAVIPPLAVDGSALTIRKFADRPADRRTTWSGSGR